MLRRLRQVAPEDVVQIFEQGLGGPDDKREPGKQPELLANRRNTQTGEPRLLAADNDINRKTDQGWWREIKQLVEQRTDHRRCHQPAMGLEMPKESSQRPTAC